VQVTRLALMNSKLTQSLSMHNLAAGFGSDSDTSGTDSFPASGTGSFLASGDGLILVSGTDSFPASGTCSFLASGTGSFLASGTGLILASGTDSFPASGTGSFLASGTSSFLASCTGLILLQVLSSFSSTNVQVILQVFQYLLSLLSSGFFISYRFLCNSFSSIFFEKNSINLSRYLLSVPFFVQFISACFYFSFVCLR
jgi:hypothetical protein